MIKKYPSQFNTNVKALAKGYETSKLLIVQTNDEKIKMRTNRKKYARRGRKVKVEEEVEVMEEDQNDSSLDEHGDEESECQVDENEEEEEN